MPFSMNAFTPCTASCYYKIFAFPFQDFVNGGLVAA